MAKNRWSHRRDGLLLAIGPHIKRGGVAGAAIADVTATILTLLGCKMPPDLDGRVLWEMLTSDVSPTGTCDTRPVDDGGRISEEDASLVERRLRGLGYL